MVGEVAFIKDKNGVDLVLNPDGTIGIGTVALSGSTVRLISGDTVQVIVRNIAGTSANVAASDLDNNLSSAVGAGPNGIVSLGLGYAVCDATQSWARLRAIIPVSGVGYRLLVSISGEPVSITGTPTVVALNSGQTVRFANDGLNNVVKTSGQTAYLANDGLNNVVKMSGQTVYTAGTTAKTNALVVCTNLSGGTTLPNITCIKCMVRSVSGNNVMYLGGTGAQAPFSGTGIELYGGEATPWIDINNVNTLSVFATTSGQNVSIFAVA